eukprot:jgi/Mesvir1/6467/Mv19542-RA.1
MLSTRFARLAFASWLLPKHTHNSGCPTFWKFNCTAPADGGGFDVLIDLAGFGVDGARPRQILLVISHPDDECMFFAPVILSLLTWQRLPLHILSLSNGGADGLGAVRHVEMLRACQRLGIPSGNVWVLNDTRMQDGFDQVWDEAAVAHTVSAAVARWQIDMILTFDPYGVSGHPNHAAAHAGVLRFLTEEAGSLAKDVRAWQLVSMGMLRKYLGPLEALLQHAGLWRLALKLADESTLSSAHPAVRVFINPDVGRGIAAMQEHRSQLVWFRQLYTILSRYSYVNEFLPLPAGPC